ncbi:MAG: repeat protein [Cyanobacteriota bacterium erpe_2018_sw_21hr_WHONDRS-SW48-000092_B_bin.40]|nr:repeat protein [Cyanobacteriota bacterium erpe_2018_sw_21hr_WHONDRS-SW48-000092_B_bin.40]
MEIKTERHSPKCRARTKRLLVSLTCLVILLSNPHCEQAKAMIMPYPMTIDKMTGASALVIKAKVISIEPAKAADGNALKSNFWQVYRAKLKLISTLKGQAPADTVDFYYRADLPPAGKPTMWLDAGPENHAHFKLEPGHSYILFAQQTNGKGPILQVSSNYTLRPWEGFFRAADETPIAPGITPAKAVWNELTKQIASKQAEVSQYAALTLLDLSCENNTSSGTGDYPRAQVLNSLFDSKHEPPLALSGDDFLKTFIASLGTMSPYSRDDYRMRYLWTVADKPMCSWTPWTIKDNASAKSAVPFLIKIADGKHKPDICAAAILTLGASQHDPKMAEAISAKLLSWLASPQEEIRAAAIILSSDYSTKVMAKQRLALMKDASDKVRKAAALSAGLSQDTEAIPQLDKLLSDKAASVRAAAALSLVSFPVDKVKPILLSHLNNHDFGVGFLCRVAMIDPASVKNELLSECQKPRTSMSGVPTTDAQMAFQNGLATDPHALAMRALLKYLDDTAGAQLSKPEFSKYLDCLEQNSAADSSLTGAAYELLITHHLNQRAAAFKKRAIAAQPTLPPIVFEQPDRLLETGNLKFK